MLRGDKRGGVHERDEQVSLFGASVNFEMIPYPVAECAEFNITLYTFV
jgi:hypothetical protein